MRNIGIAVTLVVVAMSAGVGAQMQKQQRAGVTNFTKVDAVVACGGATETAALEGLKADGFKSVVNLRVATEPGANVEEGKAKAQALGLNYFHLPIAGNAPDPAMVDQFLNVVATKANQPVFVHCASANRMNVVATKANQPVFVHCASANRVGAVWLVKRVMQDGWDVARATDEAKAIGLTAPGLEKFALDYIASHKK